jgi:hypothetical protein
MGAVVVRSCLALLLLTASAACSGKERRPPPVATDDLDGGADDECIDEDGDGFGRNCSPGRDCDDDDPDITDECRRCGGSGIATDCPCTPGTKTISCTPPVKHVAGGTLVCKEGNRYCRDGYWSICETIGEYVFFAN